MGESGEIGGDESATDYTAAATVDGDTVVQQTQYYYNAAGQTVATATFERLPGDDPVAGNLGALDASISYATASVVWYDGRGRTVASASLGREDVDSGLDHYFFDDTEGRQGPK